ncbi:MAG: hypothetical protein V1847_03890 [Candidatus Diapherotrites archaeon]
MLLRRPKWLQQKLKQTGVPIGPKMESLIQLYGNRMKLRSYTRAWIGASYYVRNVRLVTGFETPKAVPIARQALAEGKTIPYVLKERGIPMVKLSKKDRNRILGET